MQKSLIIWIVIFMTQADDLRRTTTWVRPTTTEWLPLQVCLQKLSCSFNTTSSEWCPSTGEDRIIAMEMKQAGIIQPNVWNMTFKCKSMHNTTQHCKQASIQRQELQTEMHEWTHECMRTSERTNGRSDRRRTERTRVESRIRVANFPKGTCICILRH